MDTKPYREALSHATEAVSILTIHSVNVTDTGPYSCNVTSIDTTQIQQTQVIVYGKHQLSKQETLTTSLTLNGSVC